MDAMTQPEPGSTVIRTAGDGHETTYIWNAARAADVSTEGGRPQDDLRYDSAPGEWVWTDGTFCGAAGKGLPGLFVSPSCPWKPPAADIFRRLKPQTTAT
jgi:hypothetical protein